MCGRSERPERALRARAAVLVAVAALAPGCERGSEALAGGPAGCGTDADCVPGQVCTNGMCHDGAGDGPLFDLDLQPPHHHPLVLVRQQIRGLDLDRPAGTEIVLRPSVPFELRVLVDGQALPGPVRVTATPTDAIPTTAIIHEASESRGGLVTLRVPPGSYRVGVRPGELPGRVQVPPLTLRDVEVGPRGRRLNVTWPAVEALWLVVGRVVEERPGERPLPVPGVRVYATGEAADSTTAVTMEDGAFQIYTLPEAGVFTLRLQPSEEDPTFPAQVIPAVPVAGAVTNVGDLSAGVVGPRVAVEGMLRGGADPIAGALVQFQANIGAGLVRVIATTDDAGRYATTLRPGSYAVTLVPPAPLDYGVTLLAGVAVTAAGADASAQTVDLVAERKTTLRGFVRDPDGAPLAAVTVIAERAAGATAGIGREARGETDAEGEFILRVDEGLYSVTALPPYGLSLPRATIRDITVEQVPAQIDIDLPRGRVVHGLVRSPEAPDAPSVPLAGVAVRAYRRLPGREAEDADLAGQAVSGAFGEFEMVVPSLPGVR